MDKHRFQTFLLTRLVQRNDYPSTKALLAAIVAACEIPETSWRARKDAFNELQEKAPLRESSNLVIGHSDIPGHLEREWGEFSVFSNMTRGVSNEMQLEEITRTKFWLTDEQMGYGRYGRPLEESAPAPDEDDDTDADSTPRM
ncbi:hypothetical protein [Massilia sp. X63]|uniref:hypothetical protein n=1 Tax=Massilia sp. X63 TaxID=3237285 RepID=UPI0034DD5779